MGDRKEYSDKILWKATVNILIEEKEVNLMLNEFTLHPLGVSFVSSFKASLMLVWTNQHLDNLLMCCWEGPLKISTFDKTPWDSHCPQLSPFQQGERQSNPFAPQGDQSAVLLLFHSITKDSTFAKSLNKWDRISRFSVAELKAVFLKGWKTSRDIKELGWWTGGRAGWHERQERLWLRPDDC